MLALRIILLFSILLASCQGNQSNKSPDPDTNKNLRPQVQKKANNFQDTVAPTHANSKLKLALSSNALKLVDAVSGSTRDINFGMPFNQLVEIVGRILEGEPNNIGVNTECGAGPLKMATWPNGLTLVFREKKKGNKEWLFAGWFADKPTNKVDILPKTMAGVGVGSTLEELENAYATTITKTTLGQEFSVNSGFYGILSGTGKKATIDVIWSGTSCNFR